MAIPLSEPRSHAEMVAAHKERKARLYGKAVKAAPALSPLTTEKVRETIKVPVSAEIIHFNDFHAENKIGSLRSIVPTIALIRRAAVVACEFYNVPLMDFMGEMRLQHIVLVRQVAMYVSQDLTGRSEEFIGVHLAGSARHRPFDHSTVHNNIKRIKRRLSLGDDELRDELAEIMQRVEQWDAR